MRFADVLDLYHISYLTEGHHHSTVGRIQFDCPWCSRESGRYRMGYHLERRTVSCWTCGSHPVVGTLAELTGEPWWKIKDLLKEVDSERIREKVARGKLVIPYGVDGLLPCHHRYLQGRGFDPDELAQVWSIQGIGLAARLAWRIFIPITHWGQTISWTTRALTDEPPRYISARPDEEISPARNVLFGEEKVHHACIVTEGPFDAMRVGAGAVATLGVGYSRHQLYKMTKYPVRCICFDSEFDAQQRAQALCDVLSSFPGRTVRCELDAADPGSASKKEIAMLRRRFLR